ncbi:Aldo/keto reductase [Dichomitus squalens LYAD-421 SS1]|uniref:Aldo/keto reductase n=1 Tax=Dichomitus squalens (strain LYAD-421) TaxID=732165 RepID=UPI0004411236|nr:Aldo/keto reductase [Dichomitus squalens LYAD-421 SS1]EJF63231.1 Aldo/keto reductase [Dichomitus squalens LYAD-421 SS1]
MSYNMETTFVADAILFDMVAEDLGQDPAYVIPATHGKRAMDNLAQFKPHIKVHEMDVEVQASAFVLALHDRLHSPPVLRATYEDDESMIDRRMELEQKHLFEAWQVEAAAVDRSVRILPGVKKLMDSIPEDRYAVATSGAKTFAYGYMTRVGITPPKEIINTDDKRLKAGKPAPDPFLLAAKELRFDAERCIVLEGSPSGIRAGVASDETVISVFTSHERSKIENCGAHFIVDTMEQYVAGVSDSSGPVIARLHATIYNPIINTAKLGETAANVTVDGGTRTIPFPTRRLRGHQAGFDAMPPGVKMVLNSGEFYGHNASPANLELLSRFYSQYPDYVDKTFLMGAVVAGTLVPDGSPENLRRSVTFINEKLSGVNKMDLFKPARVPPKVPIQDDIKTLVELKNEGHFQHIGLSECNATTLRTAHAVYPITSVEIEVSLFSYEDETKKAVEVAKELGVSVVAYSPLGRGFLAGTIKSPQDLHPGDVRRHLTRFEEENSKHNYALVDSAKSIAERKGVTPGQLALAWVISHGPHVIPIPGSSNKKRNLENIAADDIELTDAELAEIDEILAKTPVEGGRYVDLVEKTFHLWG